MPEITDLLASAAREGSNGPDLVRVSRRAAVLRRRQRVGRSAGALGLALVAVVLFRSVGAGTQALEQIPADRAPHPTQTSFPVPEPSPPGAFDLGHPTASPGPSSSGGTSNPTAAAPGPAQAPGRQPTSSPPPSAPAGSYPPATSCSVSTTALAPEQTATCRFTATARGGYEILGSAFVRPGSTVDPVAYIEVFRDGRTTRYDPFSSRTVCRSNIIEVGDRVTVTAGQAEAGRYYDYELAAGAGHDCS